MYLSWKSYWSEGRLRAELIITIVLLIVTLSVLANFLNYVEIREGVILPDPLLGQFSPVNLTWLIFGLIYFSLFFTIYLLRNNPVRLMFTIQVYIAVVIVRIISMYVVPFNPPASIIRLNDPFVQIFGTGQLLTKDLFFSGHTATLFLLYLVAEKPQIKGLFLAFTVVVAVAVLMQHVHYTIDVIAAPFFTFGCYICVKNLREKIFPGLA